MTRLDGPTTGQVARAGGDYAALLDRQLDHTASTLVRLLPAAPGVDDAAVLPKLWAERVDAPLLPTLALAFHAAAAGVRAQLRDALVATAVKMADVPPVPTVLVTAYLETARNRLVGVGDHTWEHTREQLLEGTRQGETHRRLARRIHYATRLALPRARVIARTEARDALLAGAVNQVRAAGLTGTKTWVAVRSPRTRPDHAHAHGQTVDLAGFFAVGGWPMDRPHDETAPAEQVVNCRCGLRFTLDTAELLLGPVPPGRARADRRLLELAWGAGRLRHGIGWDDLESLLVALQVPLPPPTDTATTAAGAARERFHLPGSYEQPRGGKVAPRAVPAPTLAPAWVLQAAAGDASSGAMVALVPSDDDADQLAVDGGEPVEQLHLTLADLGDAADWSPAQRNAVVQRFQPLAEQLPPGEGSAFGAAHWNTDGDEPSWVLNVGGGGLDDLHGHVWEILRNATTPGESKVPLPPLPEQYAPWVPHVCVAYSADPGLLADMEQRVGRDLVFDRLRVAFGGDVTDLKLAGRIDAEEAAAAAATVPVGITGWPRVLPGVPQPGIESFHLAGEHDQKRHARKKGGASRPGMGDIGLDDDTRAMMAAGSAAPHIVKRADGSYGFTEERQALHDEIVQAHLDGKTPTDDPVYNMLGGGPGSGKSTLVRQSPSLQDPNTVLINPDDIKDSLPEYKVPGQPNRTMFVHEESSYLGKRVQAAAFERRYNVTFDGVGDGSPGKLRGKVEVARAAGYRVNGQYVTIPTDVAIARADARGERSGRFVPHSVIRELHGGVSVALPATYSAFDSVDLFDNRGDGPLQHVMQWRDGSFTVHDAGLWDDFVAKGTGG